jgi:pyruvate carboxylase
MKVRKESGDLSALPTTTFFYGLKPGEEISVDIEEGKTLFVKLLQVGTVDEEGKRTITFELNGMQREARITDTSVQSTAKVRQQADPGDPLQVGAPIPGVVTAIAVSTGSKISKGDKLMTLEAMKMQTTIYAPETGIVTNISIAVGGAVESKDLLVTLKN